MSNHTQRLSGGEYTHKKKMHEIKKGKINKQTNKHRSSPLSSLFISPKKKNSEADGKVVQNYININKKKYIYIYIYIKKKKQRAPSKNNNNNNIINYIKIFVLFISYILLLIFASSFCFFFKRTYTTIACFLNSFARSSTFSLLFCFYFSPPFKKKQKNKLTNLQNFPSQRKVTSIRTYICQRRIDNNNNNNNSNHNNSHNKRAKNK
ncbi:hypothetical protein, unlikely [Trypanosoma brucei gambiense DAL972]|uniref:Uncharacterized protein n=1 Tax=Trypanosoma brucei gambiense (strain MHOM/CI/86/DAL972) TaxID=679716 RepID=C9ZQ98_TRYB9|nr:hypothetical protein, unlikely [Trypanosoma brucei gambiense DAL972]CBH11578.1 hypothetical protein, unlikely [Trypanosoma brucei gambiense DAL972]|eukprot:XP_011773863.1 hypothetical protein, unlikely [Trypanosoma brucei gambiense DAL972]